MNKKDIKKVVLAYSGGLDTSIIIPWLKENYNNPEIIAVSGNVGQASELEGLEEKAIKTGASKIYIEDLTKEFLEEYVWPGLKAGAVYEEYLLGTAFARPPIAKRIAEIEHATYKPKTYAKIYKEAKAIMVALTTAREQLFTAFRSWDEMNRFLSALYTSVENTLSYKAELYALMTISTGIGRAVALGHEIPMRTMWNTNHPNETLTTVQAALNSPDFVAYAFSVIADTKDNMKRFSVAFNNGEEPVFTPESDNRLIILSKFANNAKFGVRANTYNEELLGIGKYDKITAWQGIYNGTNSFDFGTVSKISFTESSVQKLFGDVETSTNDIENVVGFMYDKYALGITLDKKKVTQTYTAANDSFNSFYHSIVNYICNDSYNMVVFTLN